MDATVIAPHRQWTNDQCESGSSSEEPLMKEVNSEDDLEGNNSNNDPSSSGTYWLFFNLFSAWRNSSMWLLLSVIVVASLLVFSVAAVLSYQTQPKSSAVWPDCGSTPDEARSRGCSFDMLSHAWQTAECYDHEIMQEYQQAGSWEYYLDREATYPVDVEVVRQGGTDVWVREYQHYVHCTYMWRQMHRAFTVLHHIDSHLNNYNHTKHCQHVFITPREGDLLEVLARVIYPSCYAV